MDDAYQSRAIWKGAKIAFIRRLGRQRHSDGVSEYTRGAVLTIPFVDAPLSWLVDVQCMVASFSRVIVAANDGIIQNSYRSPVMPTLSGTCCKSLLKSTRLVP